MRTSEATQAIWHAIVTPIVARAGAVWWAQAIYDLLADIADVAKERDEARAALKAMASELPSCVVCPETCSKEESVMALRAAMEGQAGSLCAAKRIVRAYRTAGGTVPDAQAQAQEEKP